MFYGVILYQQHGTTSQAKRVPKGSHMKTKINEVQKLIFKMLTENTGTALCDSGGAYGRNWQRNQKKTIKDFMKQPACWLDIERYHGRLEVSPTISVFHYLTKNLYLDDVCKEFNALEVSDWDSDEFYGVSSEGEAFLLERFTAKNDSWNTYNWSANFSQVMQGIELEHNKSGERYVLVQIHGGCDVRGGYTDAKLFKIERNCEYFLDERCLFGAGDVSLDWMGSEFINTDGQGAKESDFEALAKAVGVLKDGDKYLLVGDLCE